MEKIDIVVTWVDGSDPVWQEKKAKYTTNAFDGKTLYRDYGTFKYWFRMIEKNAPWVNRVYLITDRQTPEWLNVDCEKLKIVYHDQYIPSEYLPTFNSNTIEMNLFRIEELEENFVLFNDDLFLINPIKSSEYFQQDLPRLFAIYNVIAPNEPFLQTLVNNMMIINKHFSGKGTMKRHPWKFFSLNYGMQMFRNVLLFPWEKTGYINTHSPAPHKKSIMAKMWELEYDVLHRSSLNRIRDYQTDINHYLLSYWLIESGNFLPAKISLGRNINIQDVEQLNNFFKQSKIKSVCINDTAGIDNGSYFEQMIQIFEHYFPEKSMFEK